MAAPRLPSGAAARSEPQASGVHGWRGDLRGRAAWVVFGCLVRQLGLGFGYAVGPLAGDIIRELGFARAVLVGARVGAVAEIEADSSSDAPARADDMPLRDALRTRSFWILFATLLSFWLFFLALLDHLVLFLTDAGLPRDEATAHLSNAIALGIASKLGFGWVADRMAPKSALLLDYGLLTASSLLLMLLPNGALVWIFVAAFGISTAARDVVTPLIITHCFGVRHLPQIYGVLMLTLLPGGTLGPIFAGAVHDRTGSYAVAFASFALLNALAWLALTQVRDERTPALP